MKRHMAGTGVVLIALVALVGAAPQDGPLAVVVKVTGEVQWTQAGGADQLATVGSRLGAGDQLIPTPGAQAVLVHRTGATQVIQEAVTLFSPLAGDNPGVFSRTVQVLAQAASADTRTELNRQGMIRPIPGEPILIAPRNGLSVLTAAPTLMWHAVEGATGYRVQVRAVDGGQPMRYEVEADTALNLAARGETLEAGRGYAWTVVPVGTGRATREERFQVASSDEAVTIGAELQTLSDIGLPPDGDGAFMAAIIFREMKFFYSTLDALMAVESAGDALGAEFYLLKGEALATIGRESEAEAAFNAADQMMR